MISSLFSLSPWFRGKVRSGSGNGRRRPARRHFRKLWLEVLEDRTLLSWSTVASMPTARSDLAAAVGLDGRIYAIGGFNATSNLSAVEAYNPTTNL
jgi:hypothetical protein